MKTHLKLSLVVGILTLPLLWTGTATTIADDQASAAAPSTASTVSPADKMKVMKARKDVLDSHPDLKAEQDALMKQREDIKAKGSAASPEDRQALLESFVAHQKKMRVEILKIDPTLGPVLDQMEAQMKQKLQAAQAK